jgi:hypothetical protein
MTRLLKAADRLRAAATRERHRQLDEAGRLVLANVAAEGHLNLEASRFLEVADGLDQRRVVERGHLRAQFVSAAMGQATTVVLERRAAVVRWPSDIADLEIEGRA